MQQFFVDDCQIGREYVTITGNDVKHIKNVLRMKHGEQIRISGTSGQNLLCEVSDMGEDFVQANILDHKIKSTELLSDITLFQAIPKGDRMEHIIEKCVELGVHEIVPVEMKYCVVRLDQKKALHKQKRWQAIAVSAAKQSKRSIVPTVRMPISFQDAVSYGKEKELCLVPYENEKGMNGTKEALASIEDKHSIAIYIGPEGGFAEDEIGILRADATVLSLGKRILRTDTAAITMMAWLMMILESTEDTK